MSNDYIYIWETCRTDLSDLSSLVSTPQYLTQTKRPKMTDFSIFNIHCLLQHCNPSSDFTCRTDLLIYYAWKAFFLLNRMNNHFRRPYKYIYIDSGQLAVALTVSTRIYSYSSGPFQSSATEIAFFFRMHTLHSLTQPFLSP